MTDYTDPNNYDYNAAGLQIQARQAAAKALMQAQTPTGQMVGNRYVAAPAWAGLATALENGLGGYLTAKAISDQGDLDKKDRSMYNQAVQTLLNPDTGAAQSAALAAAPALQSGLVYSNPADVGPPISASGLPGTDPSSTPPAATATPVAPQDNLQATNLPPMPPAGAPQGGPVAPQAPMPAPQSPPSNQVAPMPAAPASTIAPTDPNAAPFVAPGTPSAQYPGFNQVTPDKATIAANAPAYNNAYNSNIQAQRAQAMSQLLNTKNGAQLGNSIIGAQLTNALVPSNTPVVVGQGDSLVVRDPSAPSGFRTLMSGAGQVNPKYYTDTIEQKYKGVNSQADLDQANSDLQSVGIPAALLQTSYKGAGTVAGTQQAALAQQNVMQQRQAELAPKYSEAATKANNAGIAVQGLDNLTGMISQWNPNGGLISEAAASLGGKAGSDLVNGIKAQQNFLAPILAHGTFGGQRLTDTDMNTIREANDAFTAGKIPSVAILSQFRQVMAGIQSQAQGEMNGYVNAGYAAPKPATAAPATNASGWAAQFPPLTGQ